MFSKLECKREPGPAAEPFKLFGMPHRSAVGFETCSAELNQIMPQLSLSYRPDYQPSNGMARWFYNLIQNQEVPEVRWVDQNVVIVPWKHKTQRDFDVHKDAAVFEKYAIHTGKYKPSVNTADPKKWKQNFRAAINSLDSVQEVTDQYKNLFDKEGKEKYKAYKFLTPDETLQRKQERRHKNDKRRKDIVEKAFSHLSPQQKTLINGQDTDEAAGSCHSNDDWHLLGPTDYGREYPLAVENMEVEDSEEHDLVSTLEELTNAYPSGESCDSGIYMSGGVGPISGSGQEDHHKRITDLENYLKEGELPPHYSPKMEPYE